MMPLNFDKLPIPAIITNFLIDPPESHSEISHYPGVNGVTEVRLGLGGRTIRYELHLTDKSFVSAAQVIAILKKFDYLVQTHATLIETGNITRAFKNVTFIGFQPYGHPIRDDARTMVPGAATYHLRGMATFYQLTVREDV